MARIQTANHFFLLHLVNKIGINNYFSGSKKFGKESTLFSMKVCQFVAL